jgi:hypothetical protein
VPLLAQQRADQPAQVLAAGGDDIRVVAGAERAPDSLQ